jgi:hypothetical protein
MATKAKVISRLTEELLETAQDMRASGLMSKAAHEKITVHHLERGETTDLPAQALPSPGKSP